MTTRDLDEPLYSHLNFSPTQAWQLGWIRRRMAALGKDPRWYSLRSIRQGAASTACEMDMPEVFLRASGAWRGKAMELYRRDRLPLEQARFAGNLRHTSETVRIERGSNLRNPRNLTGPTGQGGGPIGATRDPPPFDVWGVMHKSPRERRGATSVPEYGGSQIRLSNASGGEAAGRTSFRDGRKDVLNCVGQRMLIPEELRLT